MTICKGWLSSLHRIISLRIHSLMIWPTLHLDRLVNNNLSLTPLYRQVDESASRRAREHSESKHLRLNRHLQKDRTKT